MLLLTAPALAQSFPALTGRVVDAANILSPDRRAAIEAKLKAHEDKTTDQVVVATVPSLGGFEIEDYANRLYRAWKLGTAAKNNGALLVVAPNERKVRIEVGYGLEGALTDALSGVIIRTAIAPKFKAGDFAGGIEAGLDGMLAILSGDAEEWQRRAPKVASNTVVIDGPTLFLILIIVIVGLMIMRRVGRQLTGPGRAYRQRNGTWVTIPSTGGWSSGWTSGSGSSDGGGFSGGGGSSGGGGASGSW